MENKMHQQGFSLIEITVVLFILGILVASIITPLAVSIDQAQRNEVEEQFEDIEDALVGFAIINGRLPCPDCPEGTLAANCGGDINNVNDGEEDFDGATLTCMLPASSETVRGNLPWISLGVRGLDSWNNRIQYAVDRTFADDVGNVNTPNTCDTTGSFTTFALCSDAEITVYDQGESCAGTEEVIAENLSFVVFSHGKEESDSATSLCNELENIDPDEKFVFRDLTQDDTLYFDDLIFWVSPYVLNSRLVKAELLP